MTDDGFTWPMGTMVSIEKTWETFLEHGTSRRPPDYEIEITRSAFYAGCASMLHSLEGALNEKDGTTFIKEVMASFRDQIHKFASDK